MNIVREIFRRPVETSGRTVYRTAVRGIIARDGALLMVYSPENGDYKFPGGGVDADESDEDALRRELREECGATLAQIEREFGSVIEYDQAVEADFEVFKMTSRYYVCRVKADFGRQRLDDYEAALGFTPVWISLDEAIAANRAVLHDALRTPPRWTARETFVLEYLREHRLSESEREPA